MEELALPKLFNHSFTKYYLSTYCASRTISGTLKNNQQNRKKLASWNLFSDWDWIINKWTKEFYNNKMLGSDKLWKERYAGILLGSS